MVTMSTLQSSRNGKRVSNNNILNTMLHMLAPLLLSQLTLRRRHHHPRDTIQSFWQAKLVVESLVCVGWCSNIIAMYGLIVQNLLFDVCVLFLTS